MDLGKAQKYIKNAWIAGSVSAGLPLALVFGFFFYQGIMGTFAYHKLAKQPEQSIS